MRSKMAALNKPRNTRLIHDAPPIPSLTPEALPSRDHRGGVRPAAATRRAPHSPRSSSPTIPAFTILLLAAALAPAAIVDRIAIAVGNHAIKDSDITRELRVVSFLNRDKLDLSPAARKAAAQRLIDQSLVRRDIELARVQEADPKQADQLLAQIRKLYPTEAAFQEAMRRYGVTLDEVRRALVWQLTVLRFTEQRFRPGANITDQQIRQYYEQHHTELHDIGIEKARQQILQTLLGERVNEEFYAWLDESRKQTPIRYLEEDLK